MRKGYWLSFIFVVGLFLQGAYAQGVIRTNEKGEKVIVFPDGSWYLFGQLEGGKNYPKSDASISALEAPVRLTDEDAMRIATRKVQLAKEASTIASKRAEQATLNRQRLEEELKGMVASTTGQTQESQRNTLRLTSARTLEAEALKEAALAKNELKKAETAIASGNYLQEYKHNEAAKPASIVLPKADELVQTYAPVLVASSPGYVLDWADEQGLAAKSPGGVCAFTFNGVDESSGRWKKEMRKELLFTFTHEHLRLFLKDKEYLRCEGYMGSSGGFRSLVLEFTFVYPNARELYGFIEKGSTLMLRLLSGQQINLTSGSMAKVSYDTRREELTYRVEYLIDQSVLGALSSSELDAIRVFWSSGFEEYPVYALDFIMKQLACLDK